MYLRRIIVPSLPVVLFALLAAAAPAADSKDLFEQVEKLVAANNASFPKGSTYEHVSVDPPKQGAKNRVVVNFKLADGDEGRLNRCYLVAGQAVGCAMQQGAEVEFAAAMFVTPNKKFVGQLPLKECQALGDALMAQPRDRDKLLDRVAEFALATGPLLFEITSTGSAKK